MDFELLELIFLPIIIGLLEVIKQTGFNKKFIPILSVIIGILIGIVYSGFELKKGVLLGIILGLSAVGLYSGTKNVMIGLNQK